MNRDIGAHVDLVHVGFEVGLMIKFFHSIVETLGGIMMIFLNPHRIHWMINFLLRDELLEEPKDWVYNFIVSMGNNFSISTQHFVVIYLLSHGLIKLVLVVLLWKKVVWAFPLTIMSLVLFIAYQIHRFIITSSPLLIVLSVFDLAMIVLTYMEFRNRVRI